MLNLGRNTVRHVFRNVREAACSHDRGCSKSNRCKPDVLEGVRIAPASSDCPGLYSCRSNPRNGGHRVRICKKSRHECRRRCGWETGRDCGSRYVQGELVEELVVEDVVVDCVSDRTPDHTDGKGQGDAGSNEVVRTGLTIQLVWF